MAKLKFHELRAYVKPEDYRRLEKEASVRGLSLSKTVRHCLMEYLNLRQELATAIEQPGKAGDEHTGTIIHTLLARTEERLAATIERQEDRLRQLQDQLLIMTAMIDRLYLGIMQHMPEIPLALAEGTVAGAKRIT
jgi:hypothetical protein